MNLSFEKQIVLVTGAASGMGLAAAQALAAEGAAVVLADVNEVAARAVAQQLVTAASPPSDGWMRRSITPASRVLSRKSPTLAVKNSTA